MEINHVTITPVNLPILDFDNPAYIQVLKNVLGCIDQLPQFLLVFL